MGRRIAVASVTLVSVCVGFIVAACSSSDPEPRAHDASLTAAVDAAAPTDSAPPFTPDLQASVRWRQPSAVSTPALVRAHVIADLGLKIALPHAELGALLAPHEDALLARDELADHLFSPAYRLAEGERGDAVFAAFPRYADEATSIGVAESAASALRWTRVGAAHVFGELASGRLVYADAFASTDLVVTASQGRAEELLVLRDQQAPTHFAWRVELGSQIGKLEANPAGGFTAWSRDGQALLRILQPIAIDSKQVERRGTLTWDGAHLGLDIDVRGLTFPVLVDPAVESFVWASPAVTGNPPNRNLAASAFDSVHGQLVVYGGRDETGAVDSLASTLLLTNQAWSVPVPATDPGPLRNHAMAFNGTNVVLFGGINPDPTTQDKTWLWNGSTWAEDTGATRPSARTDAAMAFSGAGKVLLFGGSTGGGETWEYSGDWLQKCGPSPCSAAPTARTGAAMAAEAGGKVLLFGGFPGAVNDETWEWNGTTWTQLCTACTALQKPAKRFHHSMVWDSNRQRVVLFGGQGTGGIPLQDTWEWTGTAWVQTASTGPGARSNALAGYDSTDKHTVLYGGQDTNGQAVGDTWFYHSRGSTCSTAADCDTGFCTDGKCCETACNGACQTCAGPTWGVCSPVGSAAGVDDADTCTGTKTCNAANVCKTKQGQTCSLGSDCLTANCVDSTCCADGCTTACRSCANASGTCTTVVAGGSDDNCSGANTCDATGTCKKGLGQTCTVGQCASGNCIDGHCCSDTCTTACRSCANASGTCTTVVASADDDNCNGASTCDVSGTCKKDLGQTCTVSGDCATGKCVDNTCCNTDCAGACDSCTTGTCTNVAVGGTGAPSCAPFVCTGASATCPTTCTTDAQCQADHYCDATSHACVADVDLGGACLRATQCKNNQNCVDGFCCDGACTGACKACSNAKKGSGANGVCDVVVDGGPPRTAGGCAVGGSTCQADGKCDGLGACRAFSPANKTCGTTLCVGNSVSGSLCDGAGDCVLSSDAQACAPAKCVTAGCTTTCASDADCDPASGFCGPLKTCVTKKAQTESCGSDAECTTGHCSDGVCCNSACSGACDSCNLQGKVGFCTVLDAGSDGSPSCSPFVCQANHADCPDTCTDNTVCAGKFYCKVSNNTCQPRVNGIACEADDQCPDAHCVDGVCCESACDGVCETCAAKGTEGTCTVAKGAPVTGLGKPATTRDCPGDPGCEGSCDGKTRDTCTALADVDTACGDASCAANIAKGGKCTTDGTCKVGETLCDPYVCGDTTCLTACVNPSDCAVGFDCANAVCVPTASNGVCSDDQTEVDPPNGMGTPTLCSPYICQAGNCLKQCMTITDCQSGFVCDTSKSVGQCIQAEAAAPSDNSGCGCRVAGPPSEHPQGFAWLGLAALGVAGLRRQRRAA